MNSAMSTVRRSKHKPVEKPRGWTPQPLELPVGPAVPGRESEDDDRGRSEDLPGSHVIVIDLA